MPEIRLKLKRPPPDDTDRPVSDASRPLFRGTGNTDYLCGHCGAVIASNMGPTQRVPFDSSVCSACGAENEFPPSLRG